jgi:SRSO17 transposase
VVAALDESGQEKTGQATVGAQRQYMGCAGRIANGVNTVYCSYATPGGHALVAARIYVPADQLADPARRAGCCISEDVTFRTKPQLAIDICRDMVTDNTMPPWAAGDEVYGRSGHLRKFLQDNGVGYVMRVGRAFRTRLAGWSGTRPAPGLEPLRALAHDPPTTVIQQAGGPVIGVAVQPRIHGWP